MEFTFFVPMWLIYTVANLAVVSVLAAILYKIPTKLEVICRGEITKTNYRRSDFGKPSRPYSCQVTNLFCSKHTSRSDGCRECMDASGSSMVYHTESGQVYFHGTVMDVLNCYNLYGALLYQRVRPIDSQPEEIYKQSA